MPCARSRRSWIPRSRMALRGLEEVRGAFQVAGHRAPPAAQHHERAHERLLRTVVEVALDAAPRVVGRAHHPPPRLRDLARDRRLGLRVARALLGESAVGDVEDDAVQPLALVALHGAAALEHPPVVARRRAEAVLELVRPARLDRHPDLALDPPVVAGMDERHVRADAVLDEVRGRIAGDPLDLVADEVHRPVRVERAPVDRARDVARQRPEQRRRVRRHERLGHGARLDDPRPRMGVSRGPPPRVTRDVTRRGSRCRYLRRARRLGHAPASPPCPSTHCSRRPSRSSGGASMTVEVAHEAAQRWTRPRGSLPAVSLDTPLQETFAFIRRTQCQRRPRAR